MATTDNKIRNFFAPALKWSWWTSWINITLGCTILAAGFVFFINPYSIVPGGVYGASIVLHNIFPTIQVGTFGYMFDIPLLLLSVLLLGAKLGARTIVAALLTPAVMNILSKLIYPTEEALHALDPSLMLGGMLDLSDHLMLASITGAVLIGIGCGIVVRQQATTGGTDIVAMLIQKYTHLRFSRAILLVDATVVLFGLLVIGFGIGNTEDNTQTSWHLSFYSLIAIYVSAQVLAYVINGAKDDKLIFIITDKDRTELDRFVLQDLERTATVVPSSGLYSGAKKDMLMLVVSRKEVAKVKVKIKEVDPNAFVIVTDAYDTFGEGWKELPSRGDIQPE